MMGDLIFESMYICVCIYIYICRKRREREREEQLGQPSVWISMDSVVFQCLPL